MRKPLVRPRKQKSTLLLATALLLMSPTAGKPDTLTREERALLDKGAVMEMYKPDEHSGHFIGHIDSVTDPKIGKARNTSNKSQAAAWFVFGIEHAQPAREPARS